MELADSDRSITLGYLQVGQLEAAALEQEKEFDKLRGELSDALAEAKEEKER